MNHFFVSPDAVREDGIHISGADYNHMKNVLRLKPGEEAAVSDGSGHRYICAVEAYTEKEAILKITDIEGKSAELPAEILLFQGIPKGDKLELIIQKAVELGVSRIIPTAMKRCVARIEGSKAAQKILRLQKIAEAAAKQSGRDLVPEVCSVMSLKEAVKYAAEACDCVIFAYEKAEDADETRQVIDGIRPGQRIAVFIGPEGGFDDREAEALEEAGARTVTLGKRILRTETAPLYILSVIGYRLEFCAGEETFSGSAGRDHHGNLS